MHKYNHNLFKGISWVISITWCVAIFFAISHYVTAIGIDKEISTYTIHGNIVYYLIILVPISIFCIFSILPNIFGTIKSPAPILISAFFASLISYLSTIKYGWEYPLYGIILFVISMFIGLYLLTLDKQEKSNLTIEQAYDYKNNSFTILRFVCALIVLLGHTLYLTDFTDNINTYLQSVAVHVFFTLSGFILIRSFDTSSSNVTFFAKRVLRIFPLFLIVAIVFNGVLVNTKGSWDFFLNRLLLGSIDGEVVGASWTLKVEFICYLLLMGLLSLNTEINARRKIIAGMFGIFFILMTVVICSYDVAPLQEYGNTISRIPDMKAPASITAIWTANLKDIYLHQGSNAVSWVCAFFVGSMMAVFAKFIPCNKHSIFWVLILILFINKFNSTAFTILNSVVFIPYVMISTGILWKRQLWTKYGDYSYGIYIIHLALYSYINHGFVLPEQTGNLWASIRYQLMAVSTTDIGLLTFIGFVLFCSILSWHLIEYPFLYLKKIIARYQNR